jgi:hypothetical protein
VRGPVPGGPPYVARMTAKPGKRPGNLTAAIVVLWIQAVANLGIGIVLVVVVASEESPDAGLTGVVGMLLAVLVLQGCLAKESAAWLTGAPPRVAP